MSPLQASARCTAWLGPRLCNDGPHPLKQDCAPRRGIADVCRATMPDNAHVVCVNERLQRLLCIHHTQLHSFRIYPFSIFNIPEKLFLRRRRAIKKSIYYF